MFNKQSFGLINEDVEEEKSSSIEKSEETQKKGDISIMEGDVKESKIINIEKMKTSPESGKNCNYHPKSKSLNFSR